MPTLLSNLQRLTKLERLYSDNPKVVRQEEKVATVNVAMADKIPPHWLTRNDRGKLTGPEQEKCSESTRMLFEMLCAMDSVTCPKEKLERKRMKVK